MYYKRKKRAVAASRQSGFIMVLVGLILVGSISTGLVLNSAITYQMKSAEVQKVLLAREHIQRKFDSYVQMPYLVKYSLAKSDTQILPSGTQPDPVNTQLLECVNGTQSCANGTSVRINLYSPFATSAGERLSGSEQGPLDSIPTQRVLYSMDATPCTTVGMTCPFEVYTYAEIICASGAATCQPVSQVRVHYKVRVAPEVVTSAATDNSMTIQALKATREVSSEKPQQNSVATLVHNQKINVNQMLALYPLPENQGSLTAHLKDPTLAGASPTVPPSAGEIKNETKPGETKLDTSAGTNAGTKDQTPATETGASRSTASDKTTISDKTTSPDKTITPDKTTTATSSQACLTNQVIGECAYPEITAVQVEKYKLRVTKSRARCKTQTCCTGGTYAIFADPKNPLSGYKMLMECGAK